MEWKTPTVVFSPHSSAIAPCTATLSRAKLGIVVRFGRVEGIASAVTDIEQGEIEPFQHVLPEGEVGIAREAVAVAQNDVHPGGIDVAHDHDRRSVVHHEAES